MFCYKILIFYGKDSYNIINFSVTFYSKIWILQYKFTLKWDQKWIWKFFERLKFES